MNLLAFALPGVNTTVSSFVIPGSIGFVASKFIFDASTKKALIVGAIIGAIGVALVSFKVPQPPNTI